MLDPVALQKAGGFRRTELNKIARLVNENREYLFDRITFDPNVMGGRACIRGLRVTVSLIVNLVANGMGIDEIIEAYPYLEADDIRQALQYAAWLAEETVKAGFYRWAWLN